MSELLLLFMLKFVGLCFSVMFAASCNLLPVEVRYFGSKSSVVEHLAANKTAFQQVVGRWQKNNPLGSFSYYAKENGAVTWNDVKIIPLQNVYEVRDGGRVLLANASLKQAGEVANVTEEELQWWRSQAGSLKISYISFIGHKLPKEERFIEISLRRSDLKSYGLIYIPDENQKAFVSRQYEAQQNQPPLIYTKLDYLEGRWFYFEGKR
jgi:hypothetical protein